MNPRAQFNNQILKSTKCIKLKSSNICLQLNLMLLPPPTVFKIIMTNVLGK
jgi:hypothetical protein